jgi:hypothetical protein
MNMSKNPWKRATIPFQPSEEETIPLDAVCGGSDSSYSTISTYPYDTSNDPASPQVDPIQVGPTG